MKSFDDLSREDAVKMLSHIRDILYLDVDGPREFYNPDKNWEGADTLDTIASVISDYAPTHEEDTDGLGYVKAEVHSDDWAEETDFNAVPWLVQAEPAEIVALAKCGWSGDYPADAVARWEGDRNTDVSTVLEHTQNTPEMGFECHVEETQALYWLKVNRPEIHRLLEEIKAV